jgi:hypothetical protein
MEYDFIEKIHRESFGQLPSGVIKTSLGALHYTQ